MKKLISISALMAVAGSLLFQSATHVHANTQPAVSDTHQPAETDTQSDTWNSQPVDWDSIPVVGTIEDALAGKIDEDTVDENAVIEPRKVIGSDERWTVTDTTQKPYSAICKLLMAFEKNGQLYAYVGSGFLIADDFVMTAAHNLYDHMSKLGQVQSVQVVPGAMPGQKPFGETSESASFYIPKNWYAKHDTDYDFGLIKLRKPLGQNAGTLKLITFDGPEQKNIELAGYPYTEGQNLEQMYMYTAKGDTIRKTGRRTLLHTIDSDSGQSGSPVFNEKGEVGAIHTFGMTREDYNGATMIDSYVIAYVNSVVSLDKPVYRLYNPNSGEHFYTMDYNELAALVRMGWNDEGMAWRSQADGIPVYRLYNPNAGDHHYTTDEHEREFLMEQGWNDEGVSWNAASTSPEKEVYRLYNPNAVTGTHHFTTNAKERDVLVSYGWNDEGKAFDAR